MTEFFYLSHSLAKASYKTAYIQRHLKQKNWNESGITPESFQLFIYLAKWHFYSIFY